MLMSKTTKLSNYSAPRDRTRVTIFSTSPLGALTGITLIVVLVVLVYLPSISGGFILDDEDLLADNPQIKASDGLYRFWCTTEPYDYWPVTNTTFWIEWRLWGMNPTGYHVTNLILHIVESLLIWLILRKLSIPGAFWAAMIFAVHPVNVESVAWIAQRKNMMAMLFFLLSIICYLKADVQTKTGVWYWLSLAAFVLAMLSKGSVAVLPVLLLGIVWWRRPLTKWDLLRTAPFFVIAMVLAGVNIWFQTHGKNIELRNAGFAERLAGAGGVVWFYLYKALLPVDLAFVYPQWRIEVGNLLWWLPLLAALGVTVALWRYRKSWSRPFLFAWGFFCVALVPVMGFTAVGFMEYSLVADHYQHVAIIGLIALVSAGIALWHKRLHGGVHWAATAVAIVSVGALAFLTWRQNGLYSNPISLYQATLRKNPDSWLVHNNLGGMFIQSGRFQEAIEHCQRALTLKPNYPLAYNNLGVALYKTGRLKEALNQFKQALLLKPDLAKAHNNLGSLLLDLGRVEEAIEHCRQAIALKSDYHEAHYNLGNALAQAGQSKEAIEHYWQALRIKPDYLDAHMNLGDALVKIGQAQEAIEQYKQALRLKPEIPEAYCNLGVALMQTGRPQEAIDNCQRALELKPDYPSAQYNLGNIFREIGQDQAAIEHYRYALRLNPDYLDAHNNLGIALLKTGRPEEAIEHFKESLRIKPDFIVAYKNLALAYASVHQSSEAIAAAEKALELARSQGQPSLARQIEDWLNSYRASLSK